MGGAFYNAVFSFCRVLMEFFHHVFFEVLNGRILYIHIKHRILFYKAGAFLLPVFSSGVFFMGFFIILGPFDFFYGVFSSWSFFLFFFTAHF